MKFKILLLFLLVTIISHSQIPESSGVVFAKEFSKDIALYEAKSFLMSSVLFTSENVTEFNIRPLAAASSGELTTLIYHCNDKSKNGLVIGFYGNYWNNKGIIYQGYSFKNLDEQEAKDFLNKIETSIINHKKFLNKDNNNNNIIFKYKDIDIMIFTSMNSYRIRVFWNGFDATWEKTSFERTKRRFEKKI